ncbi:hypothetical protein LY76DRAFT_650923 [Colletotrichum caudatum]|nr:hypothetical protein LY76DRAFT_650923 [Colletotrichum caudatum]
MVFPKNPNHITCATLCGSENEAADDDDDDEGFASASTELTTLPSTEDQDRLISSRMPAALVASPWHGWIFSSSSSSVTITLAPDAVAMRQAVDRLGSQLTRYSHLQMEEIRRRDLAREHDRSKQAAYLRSVYAAFDHLVRQEASAGTNGDADTDADTDTSARPRKSRRAFDIYRLLPFASLFSSSSTTSRRRQQETAPDSNKEPVGVRFPAHMGLAREATVDEFVAWYGPVWLTLTAPSRELIRQRDLNIAALEYLLHEREWQMYRNRIRENWKTRKWGSTPPPRGDNEEAAA